MDENPATLPLRQIANQAVKIAEGEMIDRALRATRGNKQKAAKLLQIDYKTLFNKMKVTSVTMGPESLYGTASGPAGFRGRFEIPVGILPLWTVAQFVTFEVEKAAIETALASCKWDKGETARQLGIHGKTLANKIKKYKIAGR